VASWSSENIIASVIASIHSFTTPEGLRFVDREEEIEKILGDPAIVTPGMITVLYGPKGCGKTTLFKALSKAVKPGEHRAVVTVISMEKGRDFLEIYAPRGVLSAIRRALRELVSPFHLQAGFITLSMRDLGLAVDMLARALKGLRAAKFLIVVDEVRVGDPEVFRSWLEVKANKVADLHSELFRSDDRELHLITLTSDAIVVETRAAIGSKVNWALMWNLPRTPFEVLVGELSTTSKLRELSSLAGVDTSEALWKLVGGNPRALREIARRGLEAWLKEDVINIVSSTIESYMGAERAAFSRVLEELEEPSTLTSKSPLESPDGFRAKRITSYLIKNNILIGVWAGAPISSMPKEQWVGEWYAYQIPAYHYTLKAIHRRKTTSITPRDVIEELE